MNFEIKDKTGDKAEFILCFGTGIYVRTSQGKNSLGNNATLLKIKDIKKLIKKLQKFVEEDESYRKGDYL